MNTHHTLNSLVKVFRQAFDAASKEAFEPVCGVKRSRDEALEFTHREALKAVLDAIGYQFPVDPEREAFEKWRTSNTVDLDDAFFQAWKAGREELLKSLEVRDARSEQELAEELSAEDPPWIEWKGGPCPIPDTVKRWEYRLKDGFTYHVPTKPSDYWWGHTTDAQEDDWIVAYRVLDWGNTPETFVAHGHTWFKHTPGDPCPCSPEDKIQVLVRHELNGHFDPQATLAKNWGDQWTSNNPDGSFALVGWRYAE